MPAVAPAAGPIREVIDLVSDSEDGEPTLGLPAAVMTPDSDHARRPVSPRQRNAPSPDLDAMDDYFHFEDMDLPNVFIQPNAAAPAQQPNLLDQNYDFDFFAANEVVPPHQPAGATQEERDYEFALAVESGQIFTVADCLQRVLELFPDVSHEYVNTLYDESGAAGDYEALPGPARLDNIIEKLLSDSAYPKQSRAKCPQLKRKRAESGAVHDMQQWLNADRDTAPGFLIGSMRSMLKSEFPQFANADIGRILTEKKHYFQAHVHLAFLSDTESTARRGRPSTRFANADTIAGNSGWPDLSRELVDARVQVVVDRKARAEEAVRRKAEHENLQKAIDSGETAECQACFDDLPMNRQIHCNGETAHFTCFGCAETYIKSEVGESRCRVLCTAGCGAAFDPHQLNQLSDKKLLQKLAQLEQEKAIRDAGLDDLEECPFCDYKAIVPPIDEDFEFRCANPECEKISCRRCRTTTHIPLSCEQYAKDNNINSRHKIEEAMTAALVRNCNGCKKQFIKEYGCNKMTCPSCGHLQCYICSKTLKDYNHFDQNSSRRRVNGSAASKCPLYDNVEERHEREVKAAEEAARAEVVANNPDVSVEDLQIKVSDAVKNATAQRIRQAGPQGLGGGPGGFGGLGVAVADLLPQMNEDMMAILALQDRARRRMARAVADGAGRHLGGGNLEEPGEDALAERLRRVRVLRRQHAVAPDNDAPGIPGEHARRERLHEALRRMREGAPQPAAAPAPAADPQNFDFVNVAAANPHPLPGVPMYWNAPNHDGNAVAERFAAIENVFGQAAAPAQAQHNQIPPVPRQGIPQPHANAFGPIPHPINVAAAAANMPPNIQANNNGWNFPPVPAPLYNGLYEYQTFDLAQADPAPAMPPVEPQNQNYGMLGRGNGDIPMHQHRQGFEHLELMRQANDARNGADIGWNAPFWDEGTRNGRQRPQPRR